MIKLGYNLNLNDVDQSKSTITNKSEWMQLRLNEKSLDETSTLLSPNSMNISLYCQSNPTLDIGLYLVPYI